MTVIPLPKRQGLGQKLRFEVFKRDKFTCQYCGRSAPEVVLNCDHMRPVADGGTNDILNLVTSCRDCNGGKGARLLSDASVIERQQVILEELEDRRQQLEMMMDWRDELRTSDADILARIVSSIEEQCVGVGPNESGRADIRKWLKKYSAQEIISAADEAFEVYLQWDGDKPDIASWNKAFSKIPAMLGIARQAIEKPYIRKLAYIQGILRRRSRTPMLNRIDYLEHIHLCGSPLEEMERFAARTRDFIEFEEKYDAWLAKIGKSF